MSNAKDTYVKYFFGIFNLIFKSRKQRFDQIAKTNQENIRRLISTEDYQSNEESIDDRKLIEEVLNKTKNSFNAGIISSIFHRK
jgi:hypothetical protein